MKGGVAEVTAFVFPGLDGAGHPADHAWMLALPGFDAHWRAVASAFAARPGFAVFERALRAGEALPSEPAAWAWRALAVTAMQLAAAEAVEQAGERADWLCGFSLGDLARSCHGRAMAFAQLVHFAASLPPLPCVHGTSLAAILPDGRATARLRTRLRRLGVAACRLSPRFLLLGTSPALRAEAIAVARAGGARVRDVGDCPLHTPLLQETSRLLANGAAASRLLPACRAMFSTLWGRAIGPTDDLRREFTTNVAAPIDFARAVRRLRRRHGVTRFVDLGPGRHASWFVGHHDEGVRSLHVRDVLAVTAP